MQSACTASYLSFFSLPAGVVATYSSAGEQRHEAVGSVEQSAGQAKGAAGSSKDESLPLVGAEVHQKLTERLVEACEGQCFSASPEVASQLYMATFEAPKAALYISPARGLLVP